MKRFANILLVVSSGFAAGTWLFFTAAAQNLPGLTAGPASNRVVNINWPYTNCGFAFQEATNLNSAVWQGSGLTPGFNSHTATFSVLAAATNASKFFRLAQSADLRGIYIYSGDVYSLTTNDTQSLTAALGVPGVDGLVLVVSWKALEPTNHVFNWTNLNLWMNQAIMLGKKVDLAVIAGYDTPSWLFDPTNDGGAGATQLTFTISPHDGMTSNCIPDITAPPWDAGFLVSWQSMLNMLSVHFKTNGCYSNLTLLRLTGINRTTDELRLPAETAESTHLPCVSNAPAIWQAAGYTPSNLLAGWSNILGSFQESFPDKSFSIAIIPNNAFPPIGDNGQILSNNIPDANQPLLALAGQQLPGRLVVQFNFLITGTNANPAVPQAARSYGSLPSFQVNNWNAATGGGKGAACGGSVTNPVQCVDASYLDMLQRGIYPLGQTNGLRSQYIEVFPADVISFTNAIWQAHLELFGTP